MIEGEIFSVAKQLVFNEGSQFLLHVVSELAHKEYVVIGLSIVVVVFSVVVELSVLLDVLLLQEMMVKLKRKRERIMSKCFIKFPIGYFRKTQYITSIGLFHKSVGVLLGRIRTGE